MHAIRAARLAAVAATLAALAGCGGSSPPPPPPECTQPTDCPAVANGTAACVNGACAVGTCDTGFADCDGQRADGCEVETATSLAHCGACNQACAPANATGACDAGQCQVAACSGTFLDCDGAAATGCETDPATSLAHCGACDQACAPQNATGACNAGSCAIASCTPPFSDCDANPANGCECVLQASPGITVFNQTVADADGDGVSFPGQANFWDLDGDFSLRDGGDRQFAGALVLRVGDLAYFPGDQAFSELTFYLPELGAADGVRTAAVSGPFTAVGGLGSSCTTEPGGPWCRRPLSGSASGWLASTSDSRLSQQVDLPAGATLSWTDAAFPTRAAVIPGQGSAYRVVIRDAGGAELAAAFTAAPPGEWAATPRSVDLSAFAGQRVAISFELRGPDVAMVAVDDVSVTAGGPSLVQNGGFESGDLSGWTASAPRESQNVASGSRTLAGLTVTRTVYAPPSALWARWLDVYENAGATDVVTTAWYETRLGSAGNGVTYLVDGTGGMAVSSWDTCSAAAACRSVAPGTRDVGLAFGSASGVLFDTAPDLDGDNWDLSDLVTWHHALVVPAGGRVALVHFVLMDGKDTGTRTPASLANRADAVDDQSRAIATGFWSDLRYRAGMTQAQIDAIANWPRQCDQPSDCQPIANGSVACTGGACAVGACDAGFDDCNGFLGDGCEVALATDAAHCGSCGTACPAVANGTPGCAAGACGVGSCSPPWGDCDGAPGNGCETDTGTSLSHCGACDAACAPAHATAACAAGSCGIASCDAGFDDCLNGAADGCEVELATDVDNCGMCYLACSVPNATPACVGGLCEVATCDAPFADCSGGASDGCETNTSVDLANCGGCNLACGYPNAIAACLDGSCGFAGCLPWYADCNTSLADGCEANTSSDPLHCGTCAPCPAVANGTAGCTGGACGIASCDAGFADCANGAADGCETGTLADPANCGGCGLACSLANATAACSGGSCAVAACVAPWQNCDGQAANGCESNGQVDPQHCGGCGNACPSGVCASGQCLDKVLLVVASDAPADAVDVQSRLAGTGAFAGVEVFNARTGTPTLAQLQEHQAVLVWARNPFADAAVLGDALADYFEWGGRVVVAALATTTTFPGVTLGGRFGDPATGYLLVAPGEANQTADSILIVDGASPLLQDVTAFSAQLAWKSSGGVINGGVAAATWTTTGFPLAVSGTVTLPGGATRNRADVNFHPPSSAAEPLFWTGDGTALLRNALLYR